jgi:hypothetical protein
MDACWAGSMVVTTVCAAYCLVGHLAEMTAFDWAERWAVMMVCEACWWAACLGEKTAAYWADWRVAKSVSAAERSAEHSAA